MILPPPETHRHLPGLILARLHCLTMQVAAKSAMVSPAVSGSPAPSPSTLVPATPTTPAGDD